MSFAEAGAGAEAEGACPVAACLSTFVITFLNTEGAAVAEVAGGVATGFWKLGRGCCVVAAAVKEGVGAGAGVESSKPLADVYRPL